MPSEFGSFIQKKRKAKDLNERVLVYFRLRPGNALDEVAVPGESADAATVNPVEDHDTASVRVRDLDGKLKEFKFDRFFDQKSKQNEVRRVQHRSTAVGVVWCGCVGIYCAGVVAYFDALLSWCWLLT